VVSGDPATALALGVLPACCQCRVGRTAALDEAQSDCWDGGRSSDAAPSRACPARSAGGTGGHAVPGEAPRRPSLQPLLGSVAFTLCPSQGETSVETNTTEPEWNEQISFIEMFPPLARQIKVRVVDDASMGDVAIATHCIDLQQISDPGRNGESWAAPCHAPAAWPWWAGGGRQEGQGHTRIPVSWTVVLGDLWCD